MANGKSVPLHGALLVTLVYRLIVFCICRSRVFAYAQPVVEESVCVCLRGTAAVTRVAPCRHAHVGLVEDVVAAGYLHLIITIPKSIVCECHFRDRIRRAVRDFYRTFLLYLQYRLIVGACLACILRTGLYVLREEWQTVVLTGVALLRETAIYLYAVAYDEALVVRVDTCANPHFHGLESSLGLMSSIICRSLLHCPLQTGDVAFYTVVVDGIEFLRACRSTVVEVALIGIPIVGGVLQCLFH